MLPLDDHGDGPALLLLHAGIADRTMWAEHMQPLADAGFRVIAPDLPGFGDAPVPADEFAEWNDVLATMDELGIERAALVGNSFGGGVALRVAALAPERVSALALVSASAPELAPSQDLRAAMQAEEAPLERGDIDAATAAVADAWLPRDAPGALRERVRAMQRRAFERQADAAMPPEGEDPLAHDLAALAGCGTPALLVAGEHDISDFHEAVQALAAALPRARCVTVLGAGHLVPLERPAQFRHLLLELLGEAA
jgi:3-oxoadipate enol-lactonase